MSIEFDRQGIHLIELGNNFKHCRLLFIEKHFDGRMFQNCTAAFPVKIQSNCSALCLVFEALLHHEDL